MKVGANMISSPKYEKIPELILGQHVDVILKGIRAKVRYVKGKIVYKNQQFVTIQSDRNKESICLVDFATGNAFLKVS